MDSSNRSLASKKQRPTLPTKRRHSFHSTPARLSKNLVFVSSKMWSSDSCVNILKASSSAGIYTSEATFQSDCNTPPWHSVRVRRWLPYRLYSGCLVLSLLIHNWKTREPTSWKPARLSAELDWFQSSVCTYGNSPPQPGNNMQPGSIPVQVCGCVFGSVQTWEKKYDTTSLKGGTVQTSCISLDQ